MTDTPSSITETSQTDSKPPPSPSSSSKAPLSSSSKPPPSSSSKPPLSLSSKPQSSSSSKPPPSSSSKPPPSSSSKPQSSSSSKPPPSSSSKPPPSSSSKPLSSEDLGTLLGGHWLSDAHINAAQALLRKQFPNQKGLQDPLLLAEKLQFESDNQDFVQIINVSNNPGCVHPTSVALLLK